MPYRAGSVIPHRLVMAQLNPRLFFARILRAESKRQASADDTHATAKKSKDRVGTDGHNIVDGDHNEGPMESKRNHDEAKYRSKNNAAKNGAELIDRQYGSRKQGARLLDNRANHKKRDGGSNSNCQERNECKCQSIGKNRTQPLIKNGCEPSRHDSGKHRRGIAHHRELHAEQIQRITSSSCGNKKSGKAGLHRAPHRYIDRFQRIWPQTIRRERARNTCWRFPCRTAGYKFRSQRKRHLPSSGY